MVSVKVFSKLFKIKIFRFLQDNVPQAYLLFLQQKPLLEISSAAIFAAEIIFLLFGRITILSASIFFNPSSISATLGFCVCPPRRTAVAPALRNSSPISLLSRYCKICHRSAVFISYQYFIFSFLCSVSIVIKHHIFMLLKFHVINFDI